MAYKEKEITAKFTKGNYASDCLKYNTEDLLDMFDETEITIDELGNTDGVTVNDCIDKETYLLTKDLVVTSECDDMFVYYKNDNIEVECSLELDYEFQYQSE